jgi:hypothetical protein
MVTGPSDTGLIARASPTLFTEASRERLLATHPIRDREYVIPTPMMQRTYALVRDLVWARRTGVVFYAPPRTGKTRCALAVRDQLSSDFPNVYVTLLSARRSGRPSDSHMFRLILEAEKHALAARPHADMLFTNLKADIRVKAAKIGARQYVLLIDEMQLLNDVDLQQLVCFHNSLELVNIRMTTVSFAQPEILHRRSSLLAGHERQIIARFLSDTVHFDGCASDADFGKLLRAFDLASEYPEGSGISYTQFFFPTAFPTGFRLETYCSQIWEEFMRAIGGAQDQGVTMEHVCLTIEQLLMSLRRDDCPDLTLSPDDIARAVASSNLKSFNDAFNS